MSSTPDGPAAEPSLFDPSAAGRVSVEGAVRAACAHEPSCPDAVGPDRDAAQAIVHHPEQGWSLLCNGVVLFEDTGEILPDGNCLQARRSEMTAAALHRNVA